MSEFEITKPGPGNPAECCLMPSPAKPSEATIYRRMRDVMIRSHCERGAEAHKCVGAITLTRDAIVLNCPICGDSKSLIGDE